jgi:hypothetical protein
MELDDLKARAAELSPWAHLATVGADGDPDVTPVHPCWGPTPAEVLADGADVASHDTLWIMSGLDSVKARNIAANPNVAMHWQVTAQGDGVAVWGTACVVADLASKRRLWTGVFDYDLNLFAPGGPDESHDTGFIAVRPVRGLWLGAYGMNGIERWSA